MAGIIYELIETLTQQKECYDGLCTLGKYKENAIVSKNLEFLEEVIKTEEEFAGRVMLLDKKRDVLLKDISIVTGVPYKQINITSIVEKLGPENEAGKMLVRLKEELLLQMKTLKAQNELNTTLIEHSLELVNFTINAIEGSRAQGQPASYSKAGENIKVDMNNSFFDQKQ